MKESINGDVALTIDGQFFFNFDSWRLNFRAL